MSKAGDRSVSGKLVRRRTWRAAPFRSVAMAALFLQTLTAIFVHGMTLCIEDGSAELEFALPAECCLRLAEVATESAVHPEACECTDLSLSHPAVDKKLQVEAVVLTPVALAGAMNQMGGAHIHILSARSSRHACPPSSDRRTIVLQV